MADRGNKTIDEEVTERDEVTIEELCLYRKRGRDVLLTNQKLRGEGGEGFQGPGQIIEGGWSGHGGYGIQFRSGPSGNGVRGDADRKRATPGTYLNPPREDCRSAKVRVGRK